ncbi:hypothetical protein V1512DRAFT_291950 [Lipomyces arxii]|uniref:uncharacterized protein n=1 Tax=Lipomyces arxii TaxID=56418 RepID=UPI0034CF8D8C
MLRAFAPVPVVELGAKERIQAIFASNEKLYVGLLSGTLKVYSVPAAMGTAASPVLTQAKLLKTIDKFTKKSIEQLAVLEGPKVLSVLSDGYVYLYDLDTFSLQERLHQTKGAFVMATSSTFDFVMPFLPMSSDGKSLGTPSVADIQRSTSRLVVSAKRKLHCYEWQGTELVGSQEISVPERSRSLTFVKPEKLLCGLVTEYFMVDVAASSVSPVFAAGRPVGPLNGTLAGVATTFGDFTSESSASARRAGCALATVLPSDNSVLLVNEFSSAFLSAETDTFMDNKWPIKWHDVPMMLGYSYPYILCVSINCKKLEVRNPVTSTVLQSINFPTLGHLHDGKYPFVASSRQIWQLTMRPFEKQIQMLVEQDQLDEAISLVGILDDSLVADRAEMLRDLKMRKAEELYKMRKFQQAMAVFAEVSAPPERVLSLYPSVITGEHPQEDIAAEDVPATNGVTEENGTVAEKPISEHDKLEADGASVSDAGDAQQQRDVEFFNRFLRPNGTTKTTTSGGAMGKPVIESGSLTETLANFLSFGKSTRTTTTATLSEAGSVLEYGGSELDDKALKKAVRCLLIYLIDARRKISRLSSVESGLISKQDLELVNDEKILPKLSGNDLTQEAAVVDTALLRCYMLINPQLVGPLVRLPNHCDKGVVRNQLLTYGKWNELVDFYYAKKLHRDALELLKEMGESRQVSELRGPEPIVQYLQKLGDDDIGLIFEFGEGPIKMNEQYGIDVFMANTPEAESLSRPAVVRFLGPISRSLTIKYLEHLVFDLGDLSPDFHNELALAYLEEIKTNMQAYDAEHELVQAEIKRFLRLLRESRQYKPEKILGLIPRESSLFLEARAILFSRIGEHKRALEIYVFSMKDYAKAQEYCMKVYDSDAPNGKSVFYTLLELYLRPPSIKVGGGGEFVAGRMSGSRRSSNSSSMYNFSTSPVLKQDTSELMPPPATRPQAMNLEAALELLSSHGSRVSAVDALELLPANIKMTALGPFFEAHLRTTNATVSRDRLLAGLLKTELVQTQQTLIGLRSQNVVITDTRTCPVCVKRIGSSVISVFPNRTVVHYGCAKQYRDMLTKNSE